MTYAKRVNKLFVDRRTSNDERKKGNWIDHFIPTEIGEIADSEELCEGADAFYEATTRKCSCVRNFFALNNLRSCIKRKWMIGNEPEPRCSTGPFLTAHLLGPVTPPKIKLFIFSHQWFCQLMHRTKSMFSVWCGLLSRIRSAKIVYMS